MAIGDRIRQIRKENGLTLEKVAEKLKISAQAVSKVEKGIRNPSDQTLFLFCREFGIREDWLRTGQGDPREETPGDELDAVLDKWNLPREFRGLFQAYGNLRSDEERSVVRRFIRDAAEEIAKQEPVPASDPKPTPGKSPHDFSREEAIAAFTAEWDAEHGRGDESWGSGGGNSGTDTA